MDIDLGTIEHFRKLDNVPKYLFQSAIFPASSKIRNEDQVRKTVKTFSGRDIEVSHPGFTQFDLAVSIAYKKIINKCGRFENVTFSLSDFAKCLNRIDGGKTRKFILEAFRKSNSFSLAFDFGNGNSFGGYRLNNFQETSSGEFNIDFNLDYMSVVYTKEDLCEMDLDLYLDLPCGLISWLYGFICTEPTLKNVSLDSLHYLSGSNYKHSSDFKKAVKYALAYLQKRNIIDWRYGVTRDDSVYWDKKQLQIGCL